MLKIVTTLILGTAFLISSHSAIASLSPLANRRTQCIQTISAQPVYDLTFDTSLAGPNGILSVNSVPYRNLDCRVDEKVEIACRSVDERVHVQIGSSHVAHVIIDGIQSITLPCIEK